MGLEMLEQSDMSCLCESRIGNKNFADDSEYYNLFGSKKKDRRARQSAESQFGIDPAQAKNCDYLEQKIIELENQIEAVNKKNLRKALRNREIRPLAELQAQYKNLLAQNKCEDLKLAQEKAKEQQENIATVEKIAESTKLNVPETDDKASKTQKYLIYGVGGVIALIAFVLLLKPSK